ncbi:MAG: hypothetical protein ACYC1D_16420, partial [Acidimicrobiales bacterium]
MALAHAPRARSGWVAAVLSSRPAAVQVCPSGLTHATAADLVVEVAAPRTVVVVVLAVEVLPVGAALGVGTDALPTATNRWPSATTARACAGPAVPPPNAAPAAAGVHVAASGDDHAA